MVVTEALGEEPDTRTLTTKGEMKAKPVPIVDVITTEGQCVQQKGSSAELVANNTTSNVSVAHQESTLSQKSVRCIQPVLTADPRHQHTSAFTNTVKNRGTSNSSSTDIPSRSTLELMSPSSPKKCMTAFDPSQDRSS